MLMLKELDWDDEGFEDCLEGGSEAASSDPASPGTPSSSAG
jgi:hypothetical protein